MWSGLIFLIRSIPATVAVSCIKNDSHLRNMDALHKCQTEVISQPEAPCLVILMEFLCKATLVSLAQFLWHLRHWLCNPVSLSLPCATLGLHLHNLCSHLFYSFTFSPRPCVAMHLSTADTSPDVAATAFQLLATNPSTLTVSCSATFWAFLHSDPSTSPRGAVVHTLSSG